MQQLETAGPSCKACIGRTCKAHLLCQRIIAVLERGDETFLPLPEAPLGLPILLLRAFGTAAPAAQLAYAKSYDQSGC